jgi:hypothetical protein
MDGSARYEVTLLLVMNNIIDEERKVNANNNLKGAKMGSHHLTIPYTIRTSLKKLSN